MKICYLYLSDFSSVKSGVDHKVVGKCKELEKMFPGSKFVRFSPAKEQSADDYFDLVSFEAPKKRFFNSYYRNKAQFKAILKFMDANKTKFDYFSFRYPCASFSLLKLLKAHPDSVIFEHNTNERVELQFRINEYKKKIPFSFHPSVIAYYLEHVFFTLYVERNIGRKCFKLAAGATVVTPEIGEIEKAIYNNYKTVVISNGIVPTEPKQYPDKKNDAVLNGVFIAGTYAEWNGLERIINSYKKANIQNKIHLYFVGRIDEHIKKEFANTENQTVFFIDYINKSDLENLLQKMHFAFGTCANQKRGIKEGAVLKVREALSSGLPIVNGHPDPYLQNIPELNKYCIYFPADESDLDFNLINERIRSIYQEDGVNATIHALANKYLSWEEVLKPLPAFMNSLKRP